MSTAVTTFRNANTENIVGTLLRYEEQISNALPKAAGDLNARRIIQIAATIIARDEKLRACDAGSVIAAVMQLAILGLNPTPQLAEGYLIPYGKDCTIQIGYRGWIAQYHRSRIVKNVTAGVVRSGDTFEYELGLEPRLRHVPITDIADGGGSNVTHVYAVVHLVNGGSSFVVLTKKQIDQLKARGAAGPAWKRDYESMAMAKALKQLRRFIPSDSSIDAAYASDEHVFTADALSDDGNGVRLENLRSAEPAEIAEVKPPAFLNAPAASSLDTAEDVANGLFSEAAGEIERLGAEIHGGAWPEARAKLCRDATRGADTSLSELTPPELAEVMAVLQKTQTGAVKGGKK